MRNAISSLYCRISRRLQTFHFAIITLLLLFCSSCSKFVDVGTPDNKIVTQALFNNDQNATSAVIGLYSQIIGPSLHILGGSITVYGGLTADELTNTVNSSDLNEFQNNAITSVNGLNQSDFWAKGYQFIYQANACIEGLNNSTSLTPKLKNQLLGESKFFRSLIYFYLIQLYSDVPLITTSDYNTSATQPRNSVKDIYQLIISDLNDAQNLMSDVYPSDGKLRPNRYTASALLARVYLYTGDWKSAETTSDQIISSQKYSLVSDLNKIFLAGSNEAIWQVTTGTLSVNTKEGGAFLPTNVSAIPAYLVRDELLNAFEPGDPRKSSWISTRTISSKTYNIPYKYKVANAPNAPITENYCMFRLAEEYLIRAEARIRQGKIAEGISDLNILRKRARGTSNAVLIDRPQNATQDQAMTYLLQERRIELLVEWGHRWFDLKRFKQSSAVLKPIKPDWQDTDTLFPIPNSEILLNKNLTQNNGYN